MLAAASPVLSALVDGRFAESEGVPIKLDVSHGAQHAFVSYIYKKDVDVVPDDAVDLLKLAHMYELSSLQEKVARLAVEDLNGNSAIAFLVGVETIGLQYKKYKKHKIAKTSSDPHFVCSMNLYIRAKRGENFFERGPPDTRCH